MLAPLGQVLLADGLAGKFGREHGRHFREGIEPGDEGPRSLALLQPVVDLFLDGLGEASDFTFGCFIHIFWPTNQTNDTNGGSFFLWSEKGGYGRM
jgi:hypothetical protein